MDGPQCCGPFLFSAPMRQDRQGPQACPAAEWRNGPARDPDGAGLFGDVVIGLHQRPDDRHGRAAAVGACGPVCAVGGLCGAAGTRAGAKRPPDPDAMAERDDLRHLPERPVSGAELCRDGAGRGRAGVDYRLDDAADGGADRLGGLWRAGAAAGVGWPVRRLCRGGADHGHAAGRRGRPGGSGDVSGGDDGAGGGHACGTGRIRWREPADDRGLADAGRGRGAGPGGAADGGAGGDPDPAPADGLCLYDRGPGAAGHAVVVSSGGADRGGEGRDVPLPEPVLRGGCGGPAAGRAVGALGHRRGRDHRGGNSGGAMVARRTGPRT